MPPAVPLDIPLSLPREKLNQELTQVVDRLEAGALERVRLEIRSEFHRGLDDQRWHSVDEFAEEMFPYSKSAKARRNLANRLINSDFGSRYGPTRETIRYVAQRLGIPVDDRLREATAMSTKRETTVRAILPHVQLAWDSQIGGSPPLPFRENEPFCPAFAVALAKAGMPRPDRYTSMLSLDEEVQAIQAAVPGAQLGACFWAAIWPMVRPTLPGFDRRLREAAREAAARDDPRGQRLLRHIETVETVLRVVRQSALGANGTGTPAPDRVIETAAERLTRRYRLSLSAHELTGLLDSRNVTIQAVRDRQVSAGWVIWHDAEARALADALLST
jgi:hypothetical protein